LIIVRVLARENDFKSWLNTCQVAVTLSSCTESFGGVDTSPDRNWLSQLEVIPTKQSDPSVKHRCPKVANPSTRRATLPKHQEGRCAVLIRDTECIGRSETGGMRTGNWHAGHTHRVLGPVASPIRESTTGSYGKSSTRPACESRADYPQLKSGDIIKCKRGNPSRHQPSGSTHVLDVIRGIIVVIKRFLPDSNGGKTKH
jgi:hypothetical protein